ncbi:preprotein translocase subunit SecA [Devosia aurantiaca]|uniref:Protein translocase subunit SecA n=1 Tax=Devosia aurantiaca TaxID=2714858 RepID=A0A6M1SW14_9HYPH|nr:preprotein translocase subunit SecA [Devosia aurantiaca]NGP18563.1 preprotein translocase subunit SecA [Devosia aurantiaca]
MSELASSQALPRPIQYPEKADKPQKKLDKVANDLFGHAIAWTTKPRSRALKSIVAKVDAYDERYRALDQADLERAIADTSQALRRSSGFPEHLVVQGFALVREISGRLSGRRHYGVQLIGAYAIVRGNLAEMSTGEGKTLTAALAAGTVAMSGLPVHVVTVNDYLAQRDAEITKPIYAALGLSVGVVVSGQTFEQRRAAYACDVTYCTNKELTFDYLRDRIVLGQQSNNLRLKMEGLRAGSTRMAELRMRGLHFAIVDEADSVLVDEARTPLIISGQSDAQVTADVAKDALALADSMQVDVDYSIVVDEKRIILTEAGRSRIAEYAKHRDQNWRGVIVREELARQALSARHLFHLGEQYMVREGKVQIIDEHTGRAMPDRAWSDGLHQMIEIKEGCTPSPRRVTIARMTYQRFFRRYRYLSGMSGTAQHVASELWSVYKLPVVRIPTHRPVQRIHLTDRVLQTTEAKWSVAIARIRELHERGVPILVGTRSVAASNAASKRLAEAGLPHEVLSAAQDGEEAAIVARAGEHGRITVATNMAGRGTDISLAPGVENLGGLHVLMVDRHEARRIDDQLAGRSGRQGQKGCFQAILSLEDPLMDFPLSGLLRAAEATIRPFSGEAFARWLLRFAQRRTERIHAGMRRDL